MMKTSVICVIASFVLVACECDRAEKKYTCDKDCRDWILECAKTGRSMSFCTNDALRLGIAKEVKNENLSTSEHWN